ncbi:lachesin-like isoform X2 [Brachionus plicatilis]|uniref:Lachesin-like isoform X2 n=1 Tax=Brachionus plicatilis TaxID=10195 RepID=A0A3M7RPP5_BRAPC|nr:lachesin-like isoform X2 [Brachionus plicatilis]
MKFQFGVLIILILYNGSQTVNSLYEFSNNLDTDSQIPYIEANDFQNATVGKSVSLKCIVHHLKSYKIAWYFNGILLSLNSIRIINDKYYSVENPLPNEWILVIDPVNTIHDGPYSCHVNNGLKKNINLKVGMPPVFVGNNDSQIIINAQERDNVTLTCEAEGSPLPLIYWYKNNKLIATGTQFFKKNVSRYSSAVYECVARNGIEPDPSRLFKVNINFKPTIHLMYHFADYQNNSNRHILNELELVCEITGNPINSINWFKDGIKIKDDHGRRHRFYRNNNYSFKSAYSPTSEPKSILKKKHPKIVSIHSTYHEKHFKFISKLKIKNFDESENGNYKCSANGFEGDHSKSLNINELGTKWIIDESNKDLIVNKNEKYTKKNLKILNQQDLNGRLVQTSLMHELSRGSKYNLTKSAEMVQDTFNASNSLGFIYVYIYLIVAIILNRIN